MRENVREILTVRIDGNEYRVRLGEQDPAYIARLAAHVDLRIAEIRKATGLNDPYRLLVLVCLNLADEVFRAQAGGVPAADLAEPATAAAEDPGAGTSLDARPGEEPSAADVLEWISVVIATKGDVVPPWPRK
ncbi:MAG: cell division protein ZapA [Spirochaetes bacterium]|nr:cell division protein ZapA [Spirochaetota bacterium]